jgi:hypothetical protein
VHHKTLAAFKLWALFHVRGRGVQYRGFSHVGAFGGKCIGEVSSDSATGRFKSKWLMLAKKAGRNARFFGRRSGERVTVCSVFFEKFDEFAPMSVA